MIETALAPSASMMREHLELLFGSLPAAFQDGLIELAWTNAADGRLRHASLFLPSELDKAVLTARKQNSIPGQSIYVGAALRAPGARRDRRAADKDFLALTAFYADFDGAGALETAEAACREKVLPPTAKVVTGLLPHPRGQLWWRLEEPVTDPELCRAQNRALAETLGGDTSVCNPGRVMRLAGSVAWPRKPGRVAELTELSL